MNRIVVVGNLTRDPELRTVPSGVPVCNFTIAVNRRFANPQGVREADFFPVAVWRQNAESCARYLRKGSKCCVIGTLQTRTYEAQDGTKRFAIEIQADEVEFIDRSVGSSEGGYADSQRPASDEGAAISHVDDDDLPF